MRATTFLEVCQAVLRRVDGGSRCAIVQLVDDKVLADVVSPRVSAVFERCVLRVAVEALRAMAPTPNPVLGVERLLRCRRLWQSYAADCHRFGITTQDGRLALVLVTAPTSPIEHCVFHLEEAAATAELVVRWSPREALVLGEI